MPVERGGGETQIGAGPSTHVKAKEGGPYHIKYNPSVPSQKNAKSRGGGNEDLRKNEPVQNQLVAVCTATTRRNERHTTEERSKAPKGKKS